MAPQRAQARGAGLYEPKAGRREARLQLALGARGPGQGIPGQPPEGTQGAACPAPGGGGGLCDRSSRRPLPEPCLRERPGQPVRGPVCVIGDIPPEPPAHRGTGVPRPSPSPGAPPYPSQCGLCWGSLPSTPSSSWWGNTWGFLFGGPLAAPPRAPKAKDPPSAHLPSWPQGQSGRGGLGLGLRSPG